MRAINWQDTIGQRAMRLLPPESHETSPPSAGRPGFGLDALDFVELVQQVQQLDCGQYDN